MKKVYILGLAVLGTLSACKPNLDPDVPSRGTADFTRYLAVGNSLTAGFADGSLYKSGQVNSYPNMLAKQFALVGGGDFKQPLLPGNDGYPNPKYVLVYRRGLCDTVSSIMPALYPGATDSSGSTVNVSYMGAFNNTGIPGIRAIDYLLPGYGGANPYSRRFFSNVNARPIDEVTRVNPTFFSAWVGNNDVLGYATSGGSEAPSDPFGRNRISNEQTFRAAIDTILNKLTKAGAKGVVMNIPDVTSIPFFTTVPPNGLKLTLRQANDLNAAYNGTGIRFSEGNNFFVIKTPLGVRQIAANELILLNVPQDSLKCAGCGSTKPIPGQYVLTNKEIDSINVATASFNNIIATMANQYNVPIADMHDYLKTLQSGISFNGVTYSPQFVSGGVFSLDGVHLTPRGYALVANRILETINHHYEATVPKVDPNDYPGLLFPDRN